MTEVLVQCTNFLSKPESLEVFLKIHSKILTNAVEHKELQVSFMKHLKNVSTEKAITMANQMTLDDLVKFTSLDQMPLNEDVVYEICENWCKAREHTLTLELGIKLMDNVKLELLSSDLLLSKVKTNPYISKDRYHQVLESILAASTPKKCTSRCSGRLFAIGTYTGTYDNYRLITINEVQTNKFVQKFTEDYQTHNGVYCLDNFKGDVLHCQLDNEGRSIALEVKVEHMVTRLRMNNVSLNKGTFVSFLATNVMDPIKVKQNINTIGRYGPSSEINPIGLFVLKDGHY
jgi:hypothetical protein